MPEYAALPNKAIADAGASARLDRVIDRLLVVFSREILKIVSGRVSSALAARLPFDTAGTLAKAREIAAVHVTSAGGTDIPVCVPPSQPPPPRAERAFLCAAPSRQKLIPAAHPPLVRRPAR
jgi:hypothetical protein